MTGSLLAVVVVRGAVLVITGDSDVDCDLWVIFQYEYVHRMRLLLHL